MAGQFPMRHGSQLCTWLMPLAATALMMQGCVDYVVLEGHLKDNPMDQAIASGDEAAHLTETRERLLKRFPLGRPLHDARRYLESVGATCRSRRPSDAVVLCDYRQKVDKAFRTPIGSFLSVRLLYDFRISLSALRQQLSGVEICRRVTVVHYREFSDKPMQRQTYPFECRSDPNPK